MTRRRRRRADLLARGLLAFAFGGWLLASTASPCLAQNQGGQTGPPGKELSKDEKDKLCRALDKLKCAIDSMPDSDPNKKKAQDALKAIKKAKEGKKKSSDSDEKESRVRKQKFTGEKAAIDATTTPETDDGNFVSGTEAVGAGGEYVLINEKWLAGGPDAAQEAQLGALMGHEGTRLTQKYKYRRKMIPIPEFCMIVNNTLEAWTVHIAILEAMKAKEEKKEEEPTGGGGDPDPGGGDGVKEKLCERIKTAKKVKEGWEKKKKRFGC